MPADAVDRDRKKEPERNLGNILIDQCKMTKILIFYFRPKML